MSDEGNPQDAGNATTEGQSSTGQDGNTNILDGQTTDQTIDTTSVDTADWKSSLPDDIKTSKSLQSIKSVEDLAKSFVNAQSVIGRRFEDLDADQLDQYYNKLGRPEASDGYEFELPENADSDLVDWFKKTAHDTGLSQKAASDLFNAYNNMAAESQQFQEGLAEAAAAEELKQLTKDFGPAFDERVEMANRALTTFGGDELVEVLEAKGLQNNPALVKAFAEAGKMLSEGKFVEGDTSGKFGMTSEEAGKQIEQLRTDREFMKHYTDPTSSKHGEAKGKMEGLYRIKSNNPSSKAS